MRCFFCGSFLLVVLRVCHIFFSVHCSLVVTCWERANLLALLNVMFYCVFVTFPGGVLGLVWCLIVLIPDLYLLSYFNHVPLFNFLSDRSKALLLLLILFVICVSCLSLSYCLACSLQPYTGKGLTSWLSCV